MKENKRKISYSIKPDENIKKIDKKIKLPPISKPKPVKIPTQKEIMAVDSLIRDALSTTCCIIDAVDVLANKDIKKYGGMLHNMRGVKYRFGEALTQLNSSTMLPVESEPDPCKEDKLKKKGKK